MGLGGSMKNSGVSNTHTTKCIDKGHHIQWVGTFEPATILNFSLFTTIAIIFAIIIILEIGICHVLWSMVLFQGRETECRMLGLLLCMFLQRIFTHSTRNGMHTYLCIKR